MSAKARKGETKLGAKILAPPVNVVLSGQLNNGLWLRESIGSGDLGGREFDTALNIDGKALIVNSEGLSVVFHIPWEEIVRKSIEAMEAYEKSQKGKKA